MTSFHKASSAVCSSAGSKVTHYWHPLSRVAFQFTSKKIIMYEKVSFVIKTKLNMEKLVDLSFCGVMKT